MPPNTMTLKDLENFLSSRRSAPREGGGLSRAASALRRAEEERQSQRSVFNQPREPEWQPDYVRPGGHALEAPMISPDDLIGTGIPTKIAMMLKGAAPLIGGLGIIKNKGGNWLTGSVEGALSGLKRPLGQAHDRAMFTEEMLADPRIAREVALRDRESALNSFIDKQLTRYVKNDMATPEDPIRALAERGVLHFEPDPTDANFSMRLGQAARNRQIAGAPIEGSPGSPLAMQWEVLSDSAMRPRRAAYYQQGVSEVDPWLLKADPDLLVHELDRQLAGDPLNWRHLTDELANALNPESGLPRHLLLDPKSMDRVSVPQAVERVSQINAWRAAQKAEADAMRANNAATVLHKEYPEKGMKWVELRPAEQLNPEYELKQIQGKNGSYWDLRKPGAPYGHTTNTELEAIRASNRKALEQALKYEGDTMGHCVGGYCDDVLGGRSRIYSLRDAKGQPHVTIETSPQYHEGFDPQGDWDKLPEELQSVLMKEHGTGNVGWTAKIKKDPRVMAWEAENMPAPPDRIIQIKGKGNAKPNDEYLPMVQDFVKSGQWSDVGDLQNSGLRRVQNAAGEVRYLTPEEYALPNPTNFAHGGPVNKNPLSVEQLRVIIHSLRQEHFNAA